MKNLALVIGGLITGFMVGAYIYKAKKLPDQPAPVSKVKFQGLMDTEMKNFSLAQDAEAKLKAADELYGKMVVLFMAELGLKMAETTPEIAETSVAETQATTTEVNIPVVDAPVTVTEVDDALGPGKEVPKENKDIVVDTKIGSVAHYAATPFMTKASDNVKKLTGYYAGSLTHKAGKHKGRVDSINISFHLFEENKSLQGETLIVLTDPSGHEYSRNNGGGSNRSIKSISGSTDTFYMEVSPSSYFLITMAEFPLLTGQYYDMGTLVGTVTLNKTE